MQFGLANIALASLHAIMVVFIGIVRGRGALGPLYTKLVRAAYDPKMPASSLTAGFCRGWENHQRTVTSTAAQ